MPKSGSASNGANLRFRRHRRLATPRPASRASPGRRHSSARTKTRHPKVETQRQWSDRAIARTTPVLLGLYSLVTLWTDDLRHTRRLLPLTAAWYAKKRVTFSDALASVRRALWAEATLRASRRRRDLVKVPKPMLNRLTTLACYAA